MIIDPGLQSADDEINLTHGLYDFTSAFPASWENPAVARFDLRDLSGG